MTWRQVFAKNGSIHFPFALLHRAFLTACYISVNLPVAPWLDYSTGDACNFQGTNSKLATVHSLTNHPLLSLQQFTSNLLQYFLESLAESGSPYVPVISKLFNREWQSVEPNDNGKNNSLQAISTEDQKQGMETDPCPHITSRLFLHCQI